MELKPAAREAELSRVEGFNRTFMELKLGGGRCHKVQEEVLIGPSWN